VADDGDHPNIEVFKRGYQAFASGDMDALANVFAEDVAMRLACFQQRRLASFGA
jgi:ketosteroid isomerase-like protein